MNATNYLKESVCEKWELRAPKLRFETLIIITFICLQE